MDDAEIVKRIGELTDEEHQLEQGHVLEPLGPVELERLRSLEVALDQCWDLLRQRRARRNAGQDSRRGEGSSGVRSRGLSAVATGPGTFMEKQLTWRGSADRILGRFPVAASSAASDRR